MAAVALTSVPDPPRLEVAPEPADELWEAVDRLIDRAPGLAELEMHGLQFLAAQRWRRLGRQVPPVLVQAERKAAVLTMVAPLVLERIRRACDGPIVLMKGPEAAAAYPDPALRPFRDLDLLVPDADAVHRSLVAAGFKPTGRPDLYLDLHHLRPLRLGDFPLLIEVHSRPKWIEDLPQPDTAELLAAAQPSAVGVEGILALPPAQHALAIAAHSWAHVPFGRLIQLVDIAAVTAHTERAEIEALAADWRMDRVWRNTRDAVDALFADGRTTRAQRVWARNLRIARERTVLESHFEAWMAPFSALPPVAAMRTAARTFVAELRPRPGETWRQKLIRSARAFRNAFSPLSKHHSDLDLLGVRSGVPRGGMCVVGASSQKRSDVAGDRR